MKAYIFLMLSVLAVHAWTALYAGSPTRDGTPVGTIDPARQEAVVQIVATTQLSSYLRQASRSMDRPILFHQQASTSITPMIRRRLGTGVIVTDEGHVLTTWSVVHDAGRIEVILSNGSKLEALLLGADTARNLAVLVIPPGDEKPATISRERIEPPGSEITMVGITAAGQIASVSGIIENRTFIPGADTCPLGLRVSAPVPPGVSGGPCFGATGEIIGFIAGLMTPEGESYRPGSGRESYSTMIIPSLVAMRMVDRFRSSLTYTPGWLGIDIAPGVSPEPGSADRGVKVVRVTRGSPAQESGIQQGDWIVQLDGRSINDSMDLLEQVCHMCPGQAVEVQVLRNHEVMAKHMNASLRPNAVSFEAVVKQNGKILVREMTMNASEEPLSNPSPLSRGSGMLNPEKFTEWLKKRAVLEDLMDQYWQLIEYYRVEGESLVEERATELHQKIEILRLELENAFKDNPRQEHLHQRLKSLDVLP
ncbi:S1C family serine protease [Acidobacteriota bacterium]